MSSVNDYRVAVSHVSISTNNIMTFVLKEDCSTKMPMKNTYVIRVNGVEMNNLTRVDKVKIADGVWQFMIDLTPIVNYLIIGANCLEVDGTSRVFICNTETMKGTYSLVCSENYLSIYTTMGLCLGMDPLNQGISGYYSKTTIDSSTVYQNIVGTNRFIIYYQTSNSRWVLKKTLANGKPVNQILFQQNNVGNPNEVTLTNWVSIPTNNRCGGYNPQKTIVFSACIPVDSTRLLFVNCAGIDAVNGLYYKDSSGVFVNFLDSSYVIAYYYDYTTGQGKWNLQQNCTTTSVSLPTFTVPLPIDPALPDPTNCQSCQQGCPDPVCVNATVFYTNPVCGVAPLNGCATCIPCCSWVKVCATSPGDVPSVTPLEYFDVSNPTHILRYFSNPNNNGSDWTLYDGTNLKGVSTCCHYIVGGAGIPQVNGAYKYTSPGVYQSIIYDGTPSGSITNIQMVYDSGSGRWNIVDATSSPATSLYYCDHPEIAIPPYENWQYAPGAAPAPRVICSMTPSGLVWSSV